MREDRKGVGRQRKVGRRVLLYLVAWAALVAGILACPGLAGRSVALAATFSDVGPSSTEEYKAVEYLAAAGVLSGYSDGSFRPANLVTRGQAAKIMVLQQGAEPAKAACRFSDVDGTFAAFVETAAARGWVSGYPNGSFLPYESLQRQHMAVMMVLSMGWEAEAKALTSAEVEERLARFPDAAGVSAEAGRCVAYAVSIGLLRGDGTGKLNPGAGITRGQAALMAYRAEQTRLVQGQQFRCSADHTDKTRVVLDLSASPSGVSSRLTEVGGKKVLEVIIPWAAVPADGLSARIESAEVGSVSALPLSSRPPAVLVQVELRSYSGYEVFVLEPSEAEGRGDRLVIDVLRSSSPQPGIPLVALDPGHGGSETGAIGITGLKEKDVNLTIAKRVDELLRGAGLRTVMTRTDDTPVGLRRRGEIANEAGATILVSIHNNALHGDSHGTETFYWGTSEDNYSVEGKRLAQTVQNYLVAAIGLVDRGAKTWYGNTLAVLDAANMPGIMVEVAFMDHPEEGLLLLDPAFLERAACGISRGILAYLGWDVNLIPLE